VFKTTTLAGADDPNVKVGGLAKDILGDGVEIIEFKDMQHGWTVRGDLVSEVIISRKYKR